MLPTLLFLAMLVYGAWKIVAATTVLRLHAEDPDDKIVFIPNRQDQYNPLVAQAGVVRELAKVRRRKWVVLSGYALFVLLGAFETVGSAIIGLAVIYGAMMLIDLMTTSRTGREAVLPGGNVKQATLSTQTESSLPSLSGDESGPDADIALLSIEFGITEDEVSRKYMAYAVTLSAMGHDRDWNEEIDAFGREIGALTEEEIEQARDDFDQAVLNRVRVALVAGGRTLSPDQSGTDLREAEDSIPVPGGHPEITVPHVSLRTAGSREELEKLYLTACSGAAHLLVPVIQTRVQGALPLPIIRGCALDMVTSAYETGLAPAADTDGLFIGGRTLFETRWAEWSEAGDPVEQLRAAHED